MASHEQTIEQLNKQLGDIEADIQAALHSLQSRFTSAVIVTHQRRDRADMHGRPGFFRESLKLDLHVETVIARADLEKTTNSLNHKNWSSIVQAYIDLGAGCVDDANKIALRVDDLRNVLKIIHLLQDRLSQTPLYILPEIREPPQQSPPPGPPRAPPARTPQAAGPAPTPASYAAPPPPTAPVTVPRPLLKKPSPDLAPTPAEGSLMTTTDVPYESTQRSLDLAESTYDKDNDEQDEDENDSDEETEDETTSDEQTEDESPRPWRQVG